MTARTSATGRGWAYVGALLGAGVSVAANVAHSYVPPATAGPGWSPHAGAVVGAVFWPVALLVAIEVLARVPWPVATRWTVIRFGGLGPVAVVAAVVSYRHLSGLLAYYGEDGITATVGPLAVDGLMVMATGALLATTITATTRTVQAPATDARAATTVPAVVAAERTPGPATTAPAKTASVRPRGAKRPARTADTDMPARVSALRAEGLSTAQIATELGVSTRTVRRHAARAVADDQGQGQGQEAEHTDRADAELSANRAVSSTQEGIRA